MNPAIQEFDPLLLFRKENGEAEFAVWRLVQGPACLALFFDSTAAERYRQAAGLSEDWKVFQPDRPTLHRVLLQCLQRSVPFAVLDPDHERSRLIFDIERILHEVERAQICRQ